MYDIIRNTNRLFPYFITSIRKHYKNIVAILEILKLFLKIFISHKFYMMQLKNLILNFKIKFNFIAIFFNY